ncbi:MAG: ECF transporter S component [Bacillota bacterium]|jgi:riboflavin transporter FmnP
MNRKTAVVVSTAILAAMSLILELYVHFPVLPAAPYLLYSPGDLPIIIAALVFGPIPGVLTALVNSALFVLLTGEGGPWGALMHFIASGGMAAVIGMMENRFGKTHFSLLSGVATRIALMIPANFLVTPIYTGLPVSVIAKMIVPVVIPFNIIHAGINCALAYPLLSALPRAITDKFRTRTA